MHKWHLRIYKDVFGMNDGKLYLCMTNKKEYGVVDKQLYEWFETRYYQLIYSTA
jgi:hypothetical protein